MIGTEEQKAKARAAPFGYACHRCLNCCRAYRIPLNPYDIARLARNRDQTTGAFCAEWTEDGAGQTLRRKRGGACIFLGPEGCQVHPDRPLVCRLYPLWRRVGADESETWLRMTPHPKTRGDYAVTGTIADFLEQQDAHRHIEACDEYAEWLAEAREALDVAPEAAAGLVEESGEAPDFELIDMDAAIARHCAAAGEDEPSNLEARKRLHLKILYDRLHDYAKGPA